MGRLDGKIGFITGTAGGQGRAAALAFAAEGARVVGCDVRPDDDAETAAMIRAAGGDMISLGHVDLSDPRAAQDWIARGVEAAGGIDILYNNAGAMRPGGIATTPDEDWAFTLRHELDLVFHTCRAAWPHLIERGGGAIINTASGVALRGSTWGTAHAAAKGGVVALSLQLAAEGAEHRIRCNTISPGFIESPATAAIIAQGRAPNGAPLPPVPLGRIGQPSDVAHCALYLASDEAEWVTATNIVIDGGAAGIRNAGLG
ncbi:SDR family NAD(P)-dependent oxidoreductase [Actinomadura rugatobispora]|uniref:SDR family NAD(P)-dependent oxidoreductase n=1 Tax=Actinomadura rugatobispora TaxID=1994 RepID=A0ABW0ZQ24_9ACTN|nr:SDR family NAD(P)-dependent oxidoreductase [Actinomadura rugatobispora]